MLNHYVFDSYTHTARAVLTSEKIVRRCLGSGLNCPALVQRLKRLSLTIYTISYQ